MNIPICHTSNGALLKLHHITGQGSGLVRENVFHLYRQMEEKIVICFIIYTKEEADEALNKTLYGLFTWPNSSLRLEVRAIAGVFVGSYSISLS